jgi:hypothetical protein
MKHFLSLSYTLLRFKFHTWIIFASMKGSVSGWRERIFVEIFVMTMILTFKLGQLLLRNPLFVMLRICVN